MCYCKSCYFIHFKITEFADQIRVKLTSQLIKDISKVLQKLPKYFNDTSISTFIELAALLLFKNLDLNLNYSDSTKAALLNDGSSLQKLYKLLDVFEKISLCFIKLYISITTSRSLKLSTCGLHILFIRSVNGAQFSNITCLFSLPGTSAA